MPPSPSNGAVESDLKITEALAVVSNSTAVVAFEATDTTSHDTHEFALANVTPAQRLGGADLDALLGPSASDDFSASSPAAHVRRAAVAVALES